MKWLIHLYPKNWKKQYGIELKEILEQTKFSFSIIFDVLKGILDAWHTELNEKYLFGYRMSQILVVMTIINVFIILKLKPLGEVIEVEIVASISAVIAVFSLFLAVIFMGVSFFKYGKEGLTFKPKLTKATFGLMGVYVIFIVPFLTLIN